MVNQINPAFKDKAKYMPIWKIITVHREEFMFPNQIA